MFLKHKIQVVEYVANADGDDVLEADSLCPSITNPEFAPFGRCPTAEELLTRSTIVSSHYSWAPHIIFDGPRLEGCCIFLHFFKTAL